MLRGLASAGAGADLRPLLEKLKARLQTLRVGNPLDKNTDIGAINSRAQLTRIEEPWPPASRTARRCTNRV